MVDNTFFKQQVCSSTSLPQTIPNKEQYSRQKKSAAQRPSGAALYIKPTPTCKLLIVSPNSSSLIPFPSFQPGVFSWSSAVIPTTCGHMNPLGLFQWCTPYWYMDNFSTKASKGLKLNSFQETSKASFSLQQHFACYKSGHINQWEPVKHNS